MAPEVVSALITSSVTLIVAIITILANKKFIDSSTKKNLSEIEKASNKISKGNQKILEIDKNTDKVLDIVQGRGDYTDIFSAMLKDINDYLGTNPSNSIVSLKHISVSASYSWNWFLKSGFVDLLHNQKYPTVHFLLDILIADHTYLKNMRIQGRVTDWVKESEDRESINFPTLAQEGAYLGNRFRFNARKYHNLPHWHGWLFNDKILFLGRTSWEPDNKNNAN
jgi:hypothetical protein